MKTSLTLVVTLLLTLAAVGQQARFTHIVLAVQENRTPDAFFHEICSAPYNAHCDPNDPTAYNIQTANWADKTAAVGIRQPLPAALDTPYDLGHQHRDFLAECDYTGAGTGSGHCLMDGEAGVVCFPGNLCAGYPNPGYYFTDNSTGIMNPYFDLVTQYAWANAMFQTNQGPSYPAHQFLFGGTSAISTQMDHLGVFLAENGSLASGNGGCLSDQSNTVLQIYPAGVERNAIYPCFDHTTLSDLLEAVGVTWRYYAPGETNIWTAPTSISHICGTPQNGKCSGADYTANVNVNPANVLTDIANCNLAQVSWVIPTGQNSDHEQMGNTGGPAWIGSIVNAIGQTSGSPCDYWANTAIVVVWDDWGGFYDHVAPTFLPAPQGGYQYGFRVPAIFVSAYTQPGQISNTPMDFGTIIRFVESNFGISEGALTYADSRASTDLREFYSLSQTPRPFVTIQTNKSIGDFINDTAPQTDPDDD